MILIVTSKNWIVKLNKMKNLTAVKKNNSLLFFLNKYFYLSNLFFSICRT